MQGVDEGWAFELLRFFLDHCCPGFDEEMADKLGEVFYSGLMERPDLVEELRTSWLYAPVGDSKGNPKLPRTKDRPNPEVIVGNRYTIRIYRPA